MTIAIGAHDLVEKYAAHGQHDVMSAVASINAIGRQGEPVLVGLKPRWRPTEEEVVRAAIAAILVALMTLIGLAAGAILTMG
jgi:hypothetical protein